MNRNLAAVATVLVLLLSLVIQNSAYITLIERRLKLCRSGSREDDSRVRRWGWWGPNSPLQRQCDSYRAILCKGHIAPGLEGKAPINPTSLPSDSPIPPSLPSNLPSLPPLPPSPSQLPPSLPPAEALPKSRKKRKEFETVNNVVKE
ncbi:uncharacterized protein LOC110055552 [Orbicella faveolata]|uniref:uncharacterized protein LOC110055552 n=1 Tax=Orbicella faveolata TaxID=48498 RepID=UPI0009E24A12|nr:uncharacterized protein LOC110055552 [Orbicella faveolata]